jgi:hypothetical protein
MFEISIGNLKISTHLLSNMSYDTFVSNYENDYIGDIDDAWKRAKPFTVPYKTINVKTKKGS